MWLIHLNKWEIVKFLSSQRGKGFYSHLFLVKKKMGDLHPVLKPQNKIELKSFKMESLQLILFLINLGDWILSLHLSDTYLHVPIHLTYQNSTLRSSTIISSFKAFGLSTSPRTFSKLLLPITSLLRERGMRVYHYLNDVLLLAISKAITDSLLW